MAKFVMFKDWDRMVVINPEHVALMKPYMPSSRSNVQTRLYLVGVDEPVAVDGDIADVAKRLGG